MTLDYVQDGMQGHDRRKETVLEILRELLAGTWHPGKYVEYSDRIHLNVQTVGEYAREARSLLALIAADKLPELRAELSAVIDMVRNEALKEQPIVNREGEVVGYRKDLSTALAACRDIAKLYGLNAPERRQVAVEGPAKETVAAITSELEQWEPLRH